MIRIKDFEILDVGSVVHQGGATKLDLPKKVVNKYGLGEGKGHKFLFLGIGEFILLIPFDMMINPLTIKDTLRRVGLSDFLDEKNLEDAVNAFSKEDFEP
jgi:hypothetical protein